jgi:hypothetical protein
LLADIMTVDSTTEQTSMLSHWLDEHAWDAPVLPGKTELH